MYYVQSFYTPRVLSPWSHQILKSKFDSEAFQIFVYNVHRAEGDREINLSRSFQPCGIFQFENIRILNFPNFYSAWHHGSSLGRDIWLKKNSLLMMFSSLNTLSG